MPDPHRGCASGGWPPAIAYRAGAQPRHHRRQPRPRRPRSRLGLAPDRLLGAEVEIAGPGRRVAAACRSKRFVTSAPLDVALGAAARSCGRSGAGAAGGRGLGLRQALRARSASSPTPSAPCCLERPGPGTRVRDRRARAGRRCCSPTPARSSAAGSAPTFAERFDARRPTRRCTPPASRMPSSATSTSRCSPARWRRRPAAGLPVPIFRRPHERRGGGTAVRPPGQLALTVNGRALSGRRPSRAATSPTCCATASTSPARISAASTASAAPAQSCSTASRPGPA